MFDKMLENISQQVGTYLPGILTALAVLIIGWFVAKIIAMLVGRGLRKSGLGAKLSKLVSSNGTVDASKIASKGVFYLLMLFVLITFFNVLNLPIVSKPLDAFLEQIFAYAPRLLSALGLGVAAYVLARLLKEVTRGGLEAIDIDTRISNLGQDAKALTSAADNVLDSASQAIAGTNDDIDFDDDEGFQLDDSAPVAVAPSTAPAPAATADSPSFTVLKSNAAGSRLLVNHCFVSASNHRSVANSRFERACRRDVH